LFERTVPVVGKRQAVLVAFIAAPCVVDQDIEALAALLHAVKQGLDVGETGAVAADRDAPSAP
jgi:hypothetical protein